MRIGISTIKGLILATGKPAAGISSLAALALNVGKSKKLICSILDAGRGQVYTASFRYNKNGFLEQIDMESAVKPKYVLSNIHEDVICVGEGAVMYSDIILKDDTKNILIDSALPQHIKASSVGILGVEKYARKELLSAETCVPVYLRSADARPKKVLFDN